MEKRGKKGPRTGGEDSVPSNDDSTEMTGEKKERDETVERFYLISDLLSILGHCVLLT